MKQRTQPKRRRHYWRGVLGLGTSLVLSLAAACSSQPAEKGDATPAKKDASSLHIGFSNPQGENTYLGPLGEAIGKTVKAAGAKYTEISAQVNPDKQISDVQTLIASGVDILIVYPLDARSLLPVVEQAAGQGIKVIGFNADLEAKIGEAPSAPYTGQVFDGFPSPKLAADQVSWVKENVDTGQVLYVGLAVPVPALELFAKNVTDGLKKLEGIEYVGRVDATGDNTASAVAPISAALTRFPELKAIVAGSDEYALGAAQALKGVGREGKVLVASSQLQDPGIPSIKDGSISVSWDFQNILLGKTLAEVALAAGTSDDQSSYATTIQPGVVRIDAANIGKHVGWQQQLDKLG